MKFVAYVNQTENGCDYTIACGKALFELSATTYEEAVAELKCRWVDYPNEPEECEGYYEELEEIVLYEVANKVVLSIDEWYKEAEEQKREIRDKKRENKEKMEYERLKKKFGS